MMLSKKIAAYGISSTAFLFSIFSFAEPPKTYPNLYRLCKEARSETIKFVTKYVASTSTAAEEYINIPFLTFTNPDSETNQIILSISCEGNPFNSTNPAAGLRLLIKSRSSSNPTFIPRSETLAGSIEARRLPDLIDTTGVKHPQWVVAIIVGSDYSPDDQSFFVSRMVFNLDESKQPKVFDIDPKRNPIVVPVSYFSGLSTPQQFTLKPGQTTGSVASGNYVSLSLFHRQTFCGTQDSNVSFDERTQKRNQECEDRWADYADMVRFESDSTRFYEFGFAKYLGYLAGHRPEYANPAPLKAYRVDLFKVFAEFNDLTKSESFYDPKRFDRIIEKALGKISALNYR